MPSIVRQKPTTVATPRELPASLIGERDRRVGSLSYLRQPRAAPGARAGPGADDRAASGGGHHRSLVTSHLVVGSSTALPTAASNVQVPSTAPGWCLSRPRTSPSARDVLPHARARVLELGRRPWRAGSDSLRTAPGQRSPFCLLRRVVNVGAGFLDGALWARFESRRGTRRYRCIERVRQ